MGRYRAINRYRPAEKSGQPLDLFTGRASRASVIIELLKSPWIVRGSQLARGPLSAGKRLEEPVDVLWDGIRKAPLSFEWNGKRYRIDAIVQTWAVERAWWDPRARKSQRCVRVLSRGGLYDLAYDRCERRWLLIGVVD